MTSHNIEFSTSSEADAPAVDPNLVIQNLAPTDPAAGTPETVRITTQMPTGSEPTTETSDEPVADASALPADVPEDSPEPTADVPVDDPALKAAEAHDKVAKEAVDKLTDSGFDVNKIVSEYKENGGKLTPETRQKLADAGYSEEMQDTFIAGQEARQNAVLSSFHDTAGGVEQYNAIWDWAGNNLSAGEKGYIKGLYDSGDIVGINNSILAIKQRMGQDAPTKTPIKPEASGSPSVGIPGVQPYRNKAELREAMAHPDYNTKETYRALVASRMAAGFRK